MKKFIVSWLLAVLFLSAAYAQYGTERTGYEGDYFSLEGALDLFKESYTLRDFERKLNTEENWVNNLDLNYDGRIDYIRVEHRRQGNYHAVILQALVDRYDVQDVAVIEIEVIRGGEAILQIVGDEDLYGEEVVVEPVEGYTDSRSGYHSEYGSYVNVYYWRPVQYILGRQYQVYVSPYRWQYYPTWWRPWVQCTWSVFRPRIVVYHTHYHVVHRHRVVHVHNFYRPYRSYSYTVVQRTNQVRVEHGRSPIHRVAPVGRQDGGANDYRDRPDVVRQPRTTSGTTTTTRQPSARPDVNRTTSPRAPQPSRNTTTRPEPNTRTTTTTRQPSARPDASRNTSPRAPQPSRNTTTRPESNTRTTTTTRQPSARPQPSENKSPAVSPPSRNTTTRPNTTTRSQTTTTRSSTPVRPPATSSRTAPSAQPKTDRNTAPGVRQPSRTTTQSSTTTRSRTTTTRTTTPARSPSAGSRSTAPASKPQATPQRSTPQQKSSSGSRSRRGGGDEI